MRMRMIVAMGCFLGAGLLAPPLVADETAPTACVEKASAPSAEAQQETRGPGRRMHDRGDGAWSAQGDAQKGREMRALFEQIMMARLSQELELDDAQTVLLVRRIGEVKEKAAQIRKERGRALREIEEMIAIDRSNAQIAARLESVMRADQELARLRLEAYEKAAEGLSEWQRARLYVFLQEFDSEMRRLIERARSRAHGDAESQGDAAPSPHAEPGPGRNRADRADRPPRSRSNTETPPAAPGE